MTLKDDPYKYTGNVMFEPGWIHLSNVTVIVNERKVHDCVDLSLPSHRVVTVRWEQAA